MKKVYSLIAIISTIVFLSSCGNDENANINGKEHITNLLKAFGFNVVNVKTTEK
jgi:transketolase N-terminal domain/subunit